jgi:hypothetical protein
MFMFMRIDYNFNNFIVQVSMTYHIFVDFIDPCFISIDPCFISIDPCFISIDPNFQLIEMNGIDGYNNK